jgi:hypothetical protein
MEHFVTPAHYVAISKIFDASVAQWVVHFVANCIATECAAIPAFPDAHFVATHSCIEIKKSGKGKEKKMQLYCSLQYEGFM